MDTNEIMTTEEVVVNATEELAEVGNSLTGIKIAAGIGIAAICVVLGYKFVVKPLIAKIKQKKIDEAVSRMADTEISNDFEFSTE